ncbi:MAG: thioredoxin [Chitinispirillia bacterium]|jgi:thioredoxin 1
MAHTTSDQKFEENVLQSDQPVLVDFWAPWCGPCRMVGPIIENVAQKTEGKAKVYKLNVDENPLVSRKYNITGIPTVLIFKDGQIKDEFVGVRTENVYLEALNS